MAEHAIAARLRTITALGDRVYPLKAPVDVTTPYATLQRVTTTRYSKFGRDSDKVEPTIQVDVYAGEGAGQQAFYELADAVRVALQRYSDASSTPRIVDTTIEAERDDYEPDTQLFRKSFDIRAWYSEA